MDLPTRTSTALTSVRRRYVVRGMSCERCAGALRAELTRLAAVTAVAVDLAAGTVTVDSTGPLDLADVAAAVDDAGYELVR